MLSSVGGRGSDGPGACDLQEPPQCFGGCGAPHASGRSRRRRQRRAAAFFRLGVQSVRGAPGLEDLQPRDPTSLLPKPKGDDKADAKADTSRTQGVEHQQYMKQHDSDYQSYVGDCSSNFGGRGGDYKQYAQGAGDRREYMQGTGGASESIDLMLSNAREESDASQSQGGDVQEYMKQYGSSIDTGYEEFLKIFNGSPEDGDGLREIISDDGGDDEDAEDWQLGDLDDGVIDDRYVHRVGLWEYRQAQGI